MREVFQEFNFCTGVELDSAVLDFGIEKFLMICGFDCGFGSGLETGMVFIFTDSDLRGSLMNVRPLALPLDFLFSAKQFLMLIPRDLARSLVSPRISLLSAPALPELRIWSRVEIVEEEAGVEIPIDDDEKETTGWLRILRRCSL